MLVQGGRAKKHGGFFGFWNGTIEIGEGGARSPRRRWGTDGEGAKKIEIEKKGKISTAANCMI